MSVFRKAERRRAKLRIALTGTSGAGKTMSALKLARGLVGDKGRIAVLDTESGSAQNYSHITDFDVLELTAPFEPERFVAGIRAASDEGFDAVIIDSLSHAWSGEGGVLDLKDRISAASRSGNSYTAWRDVTPRHNALVEAMLRAPLHVVGCMRSKTHYDMVEDDRGKKKPVKVGLAPVQRDGLEYEFTTVLDLSVDRNIATASKDRTGLWSQRYERIELAHGAEFREWLEHGVDVDARTIERHAQALLDADSLDALAAAWKIAQREAQALEASRALDELLRIKDERKAAFIAAASDIEGDAVDAGMVVGT